MSDDQPDFPAPDDRDEPSPADAEQESPTRMPNGQFAPGRCPNPKGRPSKRKPSTAEAIDRILARKTPSNNPAFADLTLEEGLLLSMGLQGLKNYRAALALFHLRASLGGPASGVETFEEGVLGGADVLERHIEREIRRRNLQSRTSEDTAGGEGEANIDTEDGSS